MTDRLLSAEKLHVGCGTAIIPGWCNIDVQALPGVDAVMDVTQGLRVTGAKYIYCEHFLEHLEVLSAVTFLQNCLRSLLVGGVLRLSTPNLDWVWATHYNPRETDPERRVAATLMTNRAFYAWGHRFLWDETLLRRVMSAVGFDSVVACRYGESENEELRGLERHQRYGGTDELPDVIILEAIKGRNGAREDELQQLHELLNRELLQHVTWMAV